MSDVAMEERTEQSNKTQMTMLKARVGVVLHAVQQVAGIVDKRHNVPILSNVLFAKRGQTTTLTTSDLEMEMSAVADLGGESTVSSITISAKKLVDILKSMPEKADMTLIVKGTRATLTCAKSKFVLQSLPAADFPTFQVAGKFHTSFSVKQSTLRKMIDKVKVAVPSSDIRTYLVGVLFELSGGQLRLVGTDGHRLSMCETAVTGEVKDGQFLLPRKTALELQRLLDSEEGDVRIEVADNQVRFTLGSLSFCSKLLEGKYPDYTRVIPKNQPTVLVLDREMVTYALRRADLMSDEKLRAVHMCLANNTLTLKAGAQDKEEGTEEIGIEYSGQQLEASFNVAYLNDAMSILKGDTFTMTLPAKDNLGKPGGAALILDPQDSSFRYVCMPLRV